MLLSTYLIYGHHPQLVCNSLATIAAAMFTRDLLSGPLPQRGAQHAERMFDEAGDRLFTTPEEIVFKSSFIDIVTLLVTNAYNKPIMWALKTNAIRRLVAQPTYGVLQPNSTVQVRVGVIERLSSKEHNNDRLVIEYSLVDEGVVAFDRAFLKRTNIPHRRKKISISYVF
uniref:Major sperm protein n=1 Tax=Ascaris lumbricoides TaxID=6252 RepID=A0A0M3IKI6_ASCLU